jgi:hypothetical protein
MGLRAASPKAFQKQDKYFMNSVYDLTCSVWKAYVAAKEMGMLPGRDMLLQRRFIWLVYGEAFEPEKNVRPMPVMCWTRRAYLNAMHKLDFEPNKWNDKPCAVWKATPSQKMVEGLKKSREKEFGIMPEPMLEMSAMNLVPNMEDEEGLSSADEFRKNTMKNEEAPIDAGGRTWLRTEIAQAHGRPYERNVFERVRLIEAQIGERALADFDYREEDMKEFETKKGKKDHKELTTAHVYLNSVEFQGFMNWTTKYKEQIKAVVKAYDKMFDPRWSLADKYTEYETQICELAKIVNQIKHFFMKEGYNKKGPESLHLVKLLTPIEWQVKKKDSTVTESLNWDKWALKREMKEGWTDKEGRRMSERNIHNINVKYTILSQNIACKRRDNEKYNLYRKALSVYPDEIMNRNFYEPKSETKITTCNECDVDLTISPHKPTCWWLLPDLPKAVMQFRENKAEWNPELILVKWINDTRSTGNEGLIEFMKLYEIPEKALYNLAYKRGNKDAWRLMQSTGLANQFAGFGISSPVGGGGTYATAGTKRPFAPPGKYSYSRQQMQQQQQPSTSAPEKGQVEVEDENMEHMLSESQNGDSEGYTTVMSKKAKQSYRESSSDRGGPHRGRSPYRGYPRGRGGRGGPSSYFSSMNM